jgi:hypothetical protein
VKKVLNTYINLETMEWKIEAAGREFTGKLFPSPIDGTPIPEKGSFENIPGLTATQARALIVEAVSREGKINRGEI